MDTLDTSRSLNHHSIHHRKADDTTKHARPKSEQVVAKTWKSRATTYDRTRGGGNKNSDKSRTDNQWATLKQSPSKQIKPAYVWEEGREKERRAANKMKGQKRERKRGRRDDRTDTTGVAAPQRDAGRIAVAHCATRVVAS